MAGAAAAAAQLRKEREKSRKTEAAASSQLAKGGSFNRGGAGQGSIGKGGGVHATNAAVSKAVATPER